MPAFPRAKTTPAALGLRLGGVLVLFLSALTAAAQDRTITAEADIRTLAFSKDGNSLFGVCGDNKLRQWDARSGALRRTTGWSADERFVSLASEPGLFVLGGKDSSLALSSLDTGAPVRRIAVGDRRVAQVTVARDGQTVAGSSRVAGNSREETMRLWDAAGKERFAVPSGIGGASSAAMSPDGSILAAGGWDTNIRAWSVRNGELLRLIEDLPVAVFALAFTPDGKSLVGAGVDRTVYFWETKTWKLERKLTGQPEMISALAISPDGRLLATGGFNDITEKHPVSILLWDVASGKVLRTLPAPHRVSSVAFSPGGALLAAAGGDKTVRLWTMTR